MPKSGLYDAPRYPPLPPAPQQQHVASLTFGPAGGLEASSLLHSSHESYYRTLDREEAEAVAEDGTAEGFGQEGESDAECSPEASSFIQTQVEKASMDGK